MKYRAYNTGDQIWFSQRYDQLACVKIRTHNGLVWSEDEPTLRKLEGVEGFLHQIEVFFIKLFLKVLA